MDQRKSIISPNASLKCQSSARQTSSILFLHRDGHVAMSKCSLIILVLFCKEGFFFFFSFFSHVLKINGDWYLLHDLGILEVSRTVLRRGGGRGGVRGPSSGTLAES